MKIKKISYALGSKKNLIKNIARKNFKKIINSTGISKTYEVSKNEDIISLAIKASKKVITNDKKIDGIILITQTPKYHIPPNSFIIQKQLGIKTNCIVFDLNHGCSGYIYGLKVANGLFKSKNINKILLITTDNYSRYSKNLNVKLLFSDCATATLLTKSNYNPKFDFFSNGTKYSSLSQEFNNYTKTIDDNSLNMNGNEVFNFSITEVPKLVTNFIKKNNLKLKDIDYMLLHQASHIVNDNIKRNINIEDNKFLFNYNSFGNTVSSSIPLLIAKNFKKLRNKKAILCGFGVGLSVATCFYEFK